MRSEHFFLLYIFLLFRISFANVDDSNLPSKFTKFRFVVAFKKVVEAIDALRFGISFITRLNCALKSLNK